MTQDNLFMMLLIAGGTMFLPLLIIISHIIPNLMRAPLDPKKLAVKYRVSLQADSSPLTDRGSL